MSLTRKYEHTNICYLPGNYAVSRNQNKKEQILMYGAEWWRIFVTLATSAKKFIRQMHDLFFFPGKFRIMMSHAPFPQSAWTEGHLLWPKTELPIEQKSRRDTNAMTNWLELLLDWMDIPHETYLLNLSNNIDHRSLIGLLDFQFATNILHMFAE